MGDASGVGAGNPVVNGFGSTDPASGYGLGSGGTPVPEFKRGDRVRYRGDWAETPLEAAKQGVVTHIAPARDYVGGYIVAVDWDHETTKRYLGSAALELIRPTLGVVKAASKLPYLDELASEVISLVRQRHEKYGPKNIAAAPGGAINGLSVRLHDKVARLGNGTMDHQDESLRDTFMDIVGYGLIGLMVLDGTWPN